MGQTDKQFCAFLRMIIDELDDIELENDPEKKSKLIERLRKNLQNTLEE
ncbi:MAG: hypothetical protein HFE94_01115 [Acutalibacter sp.]|nr:hypothetical protein [Acutalibacter sp.]